MIITISGTPGSGKSTVAEMLVKKLRLERMYIGGILRDLAREKGMILEELTAYAKNHPEIDRQVDEKARDQARVLAHQGKDVLVEGRVQFFFLPESLKVFMKVNPEEAARRIWKDLQNKELSEKRNEQMVSSIQKVREKILKREEEDTKRYKKLYGVDHRDESQYDIVIDTSNLTPEQVLEKISSFIVSRKIKVRQ